MKTIYEQLDGVLQFHLGNDYYEINSSNAHVIDVGEYLNIWQNRDKIMKELELTDKNDLIEALYKKLEKDGYIEIRNNQEHRKLTADGMVFIGTGGYSEKERQLNQRDAEIADMQSFQIESANKMYYVSVLLTIGTVGLLLLEILKFFLEYHCH